MIIAKIILQEYLRFSFLQFKVNTTTMNKSML